MAFARTVREATSVKLFYSPGACSLSPHIVLREVGLPYKLERVDLKTHTTAGGADFYGINGKGSVPVLQLDDGRILTEGPAIVQYLADRKPDAKVAPAARYLRALRASGVAELHRDRDTQAARPALQSQAARGLQGGRTQRTPRSVSTSSPSTSPVGSSFWETPLASQMRTCTPSSGGPAFSKSTSRSGPSSRTTWRASPLGRP